MKLINLTPHTIRVRHGEAINEIASSGVARVETFEVELPSADGYRILSSPSYGCVYGLPEPTPDTAYIVSGMVLQHPIVARRTDVFAPGTGPKHDVIRDAEGRVYAVTFLIAPPTPSKIVLEFHEESLAQVAEVLLRLDPVTANLHKTPERLIAFMRTYASMFLKKPGAVGMRTGYALVAQSIEGKEALRVRAMLEPKFVASALPAFVS
jgi:hypothetical protein